MSTRKTGREGGGRAALPDEFPIFPLTGALLLPFGRLPLNIFEPRYMAMTEDALASSRHIGMIQPSPGQAPGLHGPALHRIGCIGRLISFAETQDGRFLITLGGIIRFAVVEELEMQRGYRRVRGDYSQFAADLDDPDVAALEQADGEPPHSFDRAALFDVLHRYFAHQGVDANWSALDEMSDAALVATLAMACPFQPLEKQALLEATDFEARSVTLMALLQIDSHAANDGDSPQRPS